jgi:hypothetical protein
MVAITIYIQLAIAVIGSYMAGAMADTPLAATTPAPAAKPAAVPTAPQISPTAQSVTVKIAVPAVAKPSPMVARKVAQQENPTPAPPK